MLPNTFLPQIKLSRPSDNKKCFVCKAFSLEKNDKRYPGLKILSHRISLLMIGFQA